MAAGPLRHRTGAADRSVTLSFCSCLEQLITPWTGSLLLYFRAKKRKGADAIPIPSRPQIQISLSQQLRQLRQENGQFAELARNYLGQ
jgi:hypothetical protein